MGIKAPIRIMNGDRLTPRSLLVRTMLRMEDGLRILFALLEIPVQVPAARRRASRLKPASQIPCLAPGCGKTFTLEKDLQRHQREQHGPRRWYCSYPRCHYKLAWEGTPRRQNLQKHVKRYHSDHAANECMEYR
ncbi:hypothetical protein V2G26_012763 [Clonostachys chloroleuca]